MPPVATEAKKKKPPACDQCKARRVLCHPNPAGCPRCVEKGIECTTTPVVRRKPRRKPGPDPSEDIDAPGGPSNGSPVEPSVPNPAASSALVAPTLNTVTGLSTSTTDTLSLPTAAAGSPADISTSVDMSFAHGAFPPTAPVPFSTVASTSEIPYTPLPLVPFYQQRSVSVPPDLAKHLFDCFAQSPQWDHPLLPVSSLRQALQSLFWEVDLLPSESRTLAYCVFAAGAILSYHPSILGPGPTPTSFAAVAAEGPDLRQYGRRRAAICRAFRDEAIRRATEEGVMFKPSPENAASCCLLDFLDSVCSNQVKTRPWLNAFMSHGRNLAELWDEERVQQTRTLWAAYLTTVGRTPVSYDDQMVFAGVSTPDPAKVLRSYEEALTVPPSEPWPDILPHVLLVMELARAVAEKLLGSYARRHPLNEASLADCLSSLDLIRRSSAAYTALVDRLPEASVELGLFPYTTTSGPPHTRRSRPALLRSVRFTVNYGWPALALQIYRELQRRSSLNSQAPASQDLSARQAAERLQLHVKHARELVGLGLDTFLDSLITSPGLAVWTHLQKQTPIVWAEFLLEELETGRLPMSEKLVRVVEEFSRALKKIGYAWSDEQHDALIGRLDSHALVFRLATQSNSFFPHPCTDVDFALQPYMLTQPSSTSTSPPFAMPTPTMSGIFERGTDLTAHGTGSSGSPSASLVDENVGLDVAFAGLEQVLAEGVGTDSGWANW
ncbi:hypothetical protein JCM1840_001708 [Sporobolomyces johnsonii]